jgi:ribose/xylose/arabinose/galactoside ABC-type transport system permease subunit
MLVIGFFLERTTTGRYSYAAGYNAEVARLVGVSIGRVRTLSLVISSSIAGFAGLLLTANIQAADPSNGPSYLIPAFSAAFLGATQFRHGRFNPWGVMVAVLMLGTGSVAQAARRLPDVGAAGPPGRRAHRGGQRDGRPGPEPPSERIIRYYDRGFR